MSDVYYSVEVKRAEKHGLRGQIRQYDIGALSITSFDTDEQRVFRTQSHQPGPGRFLLFVTPSGRSSTTARPAVRLRQARRICARPHVEFYELSCPDGFINWTVKIPGDEMRRRIPDVDDYCACRFANNLPMAHVARQHIRSVALTSAT